MQIRLCSIIFCGTKGPVNHVGSCDGDGSILLRYFLSFPEKNFSSLFLQKLVTFLSSPHGILDKKIFFSSLFSLQKLVTFFSSPHDILHYFLNQFPYLYSMPWRLPCKYPSRAFFKKNIKVSNLCIYYKHISFTCLIQALMDALQTPPKSKFSQQYLRKVRSSQYFRGIS